MRIDLDGVGGSSVSANVEGWPMFCAVTIIAGFSEKIGKSSNSPGSVAEFVKKVCLARECSCIMMGDVSLGWEDIEWEDDEADEEYEGVAHRCLFPMFEDGKEYDCGEWGVWRCHKSEPYRNANSGNMVQNVALYCVEEA